ncbi:MAG: helix-turn-helix transcriptional regulator [Chloroflexi bacterium]|nr:helix-turn-helix transcriptional regulator [Chloroflexota bacterium]
MGSMGSSAKTDYCAFTKAIEHLGDRWSLLIVRELHMFGPQGFNALAAGLPGRVSRSVLSAKLRKLEELGLVARDDSRARSAPYHLAPAGEQLLPTLKSLWQWAERWVPEDAALAQRDPTVLAFWLSRRVVTTEVPTRKTVIEISVRDAPDTRAWLLLDRHGGPELCDEDPGLDESRYVYLEAEASGLLPVARGERSWSDALADRSVELYGEPDLVAATPSWFTAAPAEVPVRQAG